MLCGATPTKVFSDFCIFNLSIFFLIALNSSLLVSMESENNSKKRYVFRGVSFNKSKYLLSFDNWATAVVPFNKLNSIPFLKEAIFSSLVKQK